MKLSDWMPCLKTDGLSIFTPTPEQRLALGEEWFQRTHLPMQLRRFTRGSSLVSESELLQSLERLPSRMGNRVVVLYGAAGSGKSELMAWLHQQILSHDPARPVIRIARNELDVLSILDKLRNRLTGDYFSQTTYRRWEQMQRKPRTLAKLLTLNALEHLVESDEQINTLFYRLVSIVESQVTMILHRQATDIDIIQREDFSQIRSESAHGLPFEFEAFRYHLVDNFRRTMLENLSIRDTLSSLSDHFSAQGLRPLLLIDDLVQSINLFATEFMDYFITLDQGNWDVIVGLTPASFQSGARGKELLERINHLDTIDDRVEKMWLSDEQGLESSFLSSATASDLALAYLQAFRQYNNCLCASCPALQRCKTLQNNHEKRLAPFNESIIRRLFRRLPAGKGQVRAFLMALAQTLEGFIDGRSLEDVLGHVANAELAVETSDEDVAQVIKWYADSSSEQEIASVLGFWQIARPGDLRVTRLIATSSMFKESPTVLSLDADSSYLRVIRDWLENKTTNRQLLYPLRKGALAWLKSIQHPMALGSFHHPLIARPNRVLRDLCIEMETSPPVALESVDEFTGIVLPKSIGHLAFTIAQSYFATGQQLKSMYRQIAEDSRALELIWNAQDYMQICQAVLEQQCEMELDALSLRLYLVRLLFNGLPSPTPPGLNSSLIDEIKQSQGEIVFATSVLSANLVGMLDKLFEDWFKLRDNVYDNPRIQRLQPPTLQALLDDVVRIPSNHIHERFSLGNSRLSDVIARLQRKIHSWMRVQDAGYGRLGSLLSGQEREVLTKLQNGEKLPMKALSPEMWHGIKTQLPELYQHLHVLLASDIESGV